MGRITPFVIVLGTLLAVAPASAREGRFVLAQGYLPPTPPVMGLGVPTSRCFATSTRSQRVKGMRHWTGACDEPGVLAPR